MSSRRYLVVDNAHKRADDRNSGSLRSPLKTINAAAERAGPGDTVLIRPGVYRERVCPARGGTARKPITYAAEVKGTVFIRGSDVVRLPWQSVAGHKGLWRAAVDRKKLFGPHRYAGKVDVGLYGDCDFFVRNFHREKIVRPFTPDRKDIGPDESSFDVGGVLSGVPRSSSEFLPTTLGQLFIDGVPLTEATSYAELSASLGTWLVGADGDTVFAHLPDDSSPKERLVELGVRHTVFSPLTRGLGHIHVRDLVIEHGCNHYPTWGPTAFAQAGILSTRSGHHWVIEGCTVRHAKSVGIDCGSEGIQEKREFPGTLGLNPSKPTDVVFDFAGWHVIRDNDISDNGHCGLCGIGHTGSRVIGNRIERNNRDAHPSPYWEFAGIKFHHFFDGLIEGNLIRDNDCHGIWIDNQWRGSRITRNTIVNNLWSGINVELGRGPVLIDTNVIAHTRQGEGIYGHDCADVTIAHNLLYANAGFGVWFAYATPRVPPDTGAWDIRTFNNLILGNRTGAIGYSLPWTCAGRNVSDGNLFMGSGVACDEGSGARATLFQINNLSHCAQYKGHNHQEEPLTPEWVAEQLKAALDKAGVPETSRPNLREWTDHFLVNLATWRAATGNDLHSAQMVKINRDTFGARICRWHAKIDEALNEVTCEAVPGVERDWHGCPMPARPKPGPFQDLVVGQQNRLLVPPLVTHDSTRSNRRKKGLVGNGPR